MTGRLIRGGRLKGVRLYTKENSIQVRYLLKNIWYFYLRVKFNFDICNRREQLKKRTKLLV